MGEIKEAHEKGYKLVLPDGKEMNGPGFYRIDFMNQIFFLLERAMWLDRDLIICECGDCSDDGFPSCFDGGMDKMIEICELCRDGNRCRCPSVNLRQVGDIISPIR